MPPARHRTFSQLARENGLKQFTPAILRFGDRNTRETHYAYIEQPAGKTSRRTPRIIVFEETGSQIDVRVYRQK